MNLAELQKKLTAAARSQPADEWVPYAFEKRVMALIEGRAVVDVAAEWAHGLWRAAVSCVILVLLLGALSWIFLPTVNSSNNLSQEFENTLLVSASPTNNVLVP